VGREGGEEEESWNSHQFAGAWLQFIGVEFQVFIK